MVFTSWGAFMKGDKRPIENEGSYWFDVARENMRYKNAMKKHLDNTFHKQADDTFWEWLENETGVKRI